MVREVSIEDISSKQPFTSTQMELVEKHPGWRGIATMGEAASALEGHRPLTFTLTYLIAEQTHILSYVHADQTIKHVIFTRDCDKNKWCYKNGYENEFPSLNEMIKSAMHCQEPPIPLYGIPLP